jgi:VCBS repeat-containing protein
VNAPIFSSGTIVGQLTEDAASLLQIAPQTFTFTDQGMNSPGDADSQFPLVTAPANAIGTFNAVLLDDATGQGGDTTGTIQWSYSVNTAVVQYLAAGQTLQQVYQIEVFDLDGNSFTQHITITITGTNDAPIISSAAPNHAFGEDDTAITVTSTLAFTDADITDTHTLSSVTVNASGITNGLAADNAALIAMLSTTVSTTTGTPSAPSAGQIGYTFSANSAQFQYLAQGEELTLTYTLTLSDGQGGTATQTLAITITGTNDIPTLAPVSFSQTDTADNDIFATSTGTLVATDADGTDTLTYGLNGSSPSSEAGFDIQTTGIYGTLYLNTATGAYSFVPNSVAVQGLSTGESATEWFTLSVTDGRSDAVTNTLTFFLSGANDTAEVTGDISGTVVEAADTAGTPTVSGDLNHTDRDNADVDDAWTPVTDGRTSYGRLTVGADGRWTYTLDNTNPAVQALREGQTLTDTATVFTTGGTAQTLTFTINGANDASVSVGSSGQLSEAGGVLNGTNETPSVTGDIDHTDVDNANDVWQPATLTGQYGTLVIGANGAWTYTTDQTNAAVQALSAVADTLTDTIRVRSGDGTEHAITITITGADDAAEVTGDISGTIDEAGGVANAEDSNAVAGQISGDLNHTDSDSDDADDAWTPISSQVTTYGTFTMLANGQWTYTLNNDLPAVQALNNESDPLTDTITVTTTGGTEQRINITITGTNDDAVISGSTTGTVQEAGGLNNADAGIPTVTGTLTAADVDNTPNSWIAQTDNDVYGTFTLTEAGVWTYTLDNSRPATQALAGGASVPRSFQVVTIDNTLTTVTVTIAGSNDAPTVTAGGITTGALTEPTGTGQFNLRDADLSGSFTVTDLDTGTVWAETNAGPTFAWSAGDLTTSVLANSARTAITNAFTADINPSGQVTWRFDANTTSNINLNFLAAGETLTVTFNVTVTDGAGGSVVQPVVITFTGTNDTPTGTEAWGVYITEGQAITRGDGSVTGTDNDLTGTLIDGQHRVVAVDNAVSGTVGESNATYAIAFTDLDLNNTGHTVAQSVTTTASSGVTIPSGINFLSFMTSSLAFTSAGNGGQINWTFQAPDSAFDFLAAGQTLTITYQFNVTDQNNATTTGAGRTITVTVTGTNDAPTITMESEGAVTEDGTSAGTASITGTLAGADGANWVDIDTTDDPLLAVNRGSHGTDAQSLLTFDQTAPGAETVDYAVINGTYGTLYLRANGTYTYVLDNTRAATQALDEGSNGTEVFNYTVTDRAEATAISRLTITVNGANDGPVFGTVTAPADVVEDAAAAAQDISLSGSFDVSDVDANDTLSIVVGTPVVALAGSSNPLPAGLAEALSAALSASGTVNSNSGAGGLTIGWSFTANDLNLDFLNNGDRLTVTFPIRVSDGTAQSAPQNLTITFLGTNDAPILANDTGAVTEAGNATAGTSSVNGNVLTNDSDPDQDAVLSVTAVELPGGASSAEVGTDTQIIGTYGVLTISSNGAWSYALRNDFAATQALDDGANGTDTFTLITSDENGATRGQTLSINVTGTNDLPAVTSVSNIEAVAEAVDAAAQAISVNGTITVSDVDQNDTLTASHGTPVVLMNGEPFSLPPDVAAGLIGAGVLTFTGTPNSDAGTPQSISWIYSGTADLNFLRAGQTLTITFPVSVSDGTGASQTQPLTITITGSNDGPIAVADASSQEAGTILKEAGDEPALAGQPTASGNVLTNDIELDQGDTQQVTLAGAGTAVPTDAVTNTGITVIGIYGTLLINHDGSWSYTLNNADADTQALAAGQRVTDVFTYVMQDGSGATSSATLTLHIEGSNDGPVLTPGIVTGSMTEGPDGAPDGDNVPTTLSGTIAFADRDAADRPGSDGSASTGATLTAALAVTGSSLNAEQLTAANALISAFSLSLSDGATNTGTINWSFAPTPAALDFLRAAQTATLTFTVTLNDGNGGTASQNVTINLTGANDGVGLLEGGARTGTVTERTEAEEQTSPSPESLEATGSFRFTDPDLAANPVQILNHLGVLNGASQFGGTLTQINRIVDAATGTKEVTWTYRIDPANLNLQQLGAGETLTETFTIRVLDQAAGGILLQPITITLTGTNDRPVITATDVTGSTTEGDLLASMTNSGSISFDDLDTTDLVSVTHAFQNVGWSGGTLPAGQQAELEAALANAFTLSGAGTAAAANSGAVTWNFSLLSTMVEFLGAGQTLTVTYRITATDDSGDTATNSATQNVTITITGTNDLPVITGQDTGDRSVTEGTESVASGTLQIMDLDAGEAIFRVLTNQAATYGTYSINAAGEWSYTLNNQNETVQALSAGETITDTLTFTAADGTTTTVAITITGTNDAPVITGQTAGDRSVTEESDLSASGTLGVTDVDDGEATFQPQTGTAASFGTYSINAAGEWSYTLNNQNETVQALSAGETITDTLTFTTADGTTTTVDIIITGTNDAPVITGQTAGDRSVTEESDLSASGSLGVTDVDDGEATFQRQTGTAASFGTYSINAAGEWSYTLNNQNETVQALSAGETVTDTLTFTTADGTTTTVDITITGTNDAPVVTTADGANLGTVEDQGERSDGAVAGALTASGQLTASDADEGETAGLTWSTTSTSAYGTFTLNPNGSWTFTLNPAVAESLSENDTITEQFTAIVSDGQGGTAQQVVTVRINGTNDAPVISTTSTVTGSVTETGTGTTPPATPVTATGTLVATDPDTGDTLAWSIVGAAAGTFGNLTLSGAVWTYTLDDSLATTQALTTGQTRTETFTLRVTDSQGVSRDQTITVTVTGRNEVFTGFDDIDDNLTGTGTADSLIGLSGDDTLSGASGNDVIFGGLGDDSMVGGSGDDMIHADGGSDIAEGGSGNDTLVLASNWADYDISFAGGAYTFTAANGDSVRATGIESIRFGDGPAVAIAAVLNDTPTAGTDSATIAEDGTLTIPLSVLLGNDEDADTPLGDILTITAVSAGSGGSVRIDGNNVVFTPTPNFNGPASFSYTVTDANGATATGTVNVTVTPVNDAPVVASPLADQAGSEDTAFTFTVPSGTFTDVDNTTLTLSLGAGTPEWLSISAEGVISGTPPANFNGTVSVTVVATDAGGLTATSTFNIAIAAVNDAPVVASPLADQAGSEDTAFTFTVPSGTFTDVDDTTLTLSLGAGTPEWLSISAEGVISGTPPANFNGTVSVTVVATDAGGLTATSTFNIAIAAVNDAPVVASPLADQAGSEDTAFTFTVPPGTFTDVDNATLTLSLGAGAPEWLSINAEGVISGTPPANFNGTVSVTVVATDAGGLTATSTFNIAIAAVNDAPVFTGILPDQFLDEDTPYSYTVPEGTFADVDDDTVTYSLAVGSPQWLSINGTTGQITGVPPTDFTGTVTVTVVATDAGGLTASESFDLAVTPFNDAPAVSVTVTPGLRENPALGAVAAVLEVTDVDSDPANSSFFLEDDAGGRFALDGSNIVVANPLLLDFEQASSYTVRVRVTDEGGAQTTRVITINLADEVSETVIGSAADNLIVSEAGNDSLSGLGGNDRLVAGAGNDTLDGGTGNDTLEGGTGDDLYIVDGAGDVIVEGAGNGTDTVRTSVRYSLGANAHIEHLATTDDAGTAAINLIGNGFSQTITGNAGVNNLLGGGGNDILFGGAGNDSLTGGTGIDTLHGGAGNDVYFIDDADDAIVETAGNGTADRVIASVSFALAEDDNIETMATVAQAATTPINLTGNSLAQSITGNAGANLLSGLGGNDRLIAGAGNDTLDGGTGNDTLEGGTGDDLYIVDGAGDVIVEGAGNGTDTVRTSVRYSLATDAHIEHLATTDDSGTAAINLIGNGFSQTITGNAGVNNLLGGGGNDILFGGAGNDSLTGGTGIDTLHGGAGNDVYFIDDADDAIVETAGNGTADRVIASVSFALAEDDNIETMATVAQAATTPINLTGNGLAQSITGNAGANLLSGLGGDDRLNGRGGNDTLDGGTGNDTLEGGTGSDTFVFTNNFGRDVITDFNTAAVGEVINLSALTNIEDWTDLTTNHLRTEGGNAVIFDGTNTITLNGVTIASLSAGDFLF